MCVEKYQRYSADKDWNHCDEIEEARQLLSVLGGPLSDVCSVVVNWESSSDLH